MVIAQIKEFVRRHPSTEWGPAHIVLSDYNVYDDQIRFCLNELLQTKKTLDTEATRGFLENLLEIPEQDRVEEVEL